MESPGHKTETAKAAFEDNNDGRAGATTGLGVIAGNDEATDDMQGAKVGAVPTMEAMPAPTSNASTIITRKTKDVIA